jgi:acyl dehydratase
MTAKTARTIDEVRALVGAELGVGPWVEITQQRVDAFAEVTGDDQFIHVDPERAARTPFGGTIAHGYLTLSLLPWLARGREGIRFELGQRMNVNYGLNKVRFISPVKVGARIRLRTRLDGLDQVGPDVYLLTYGQIVEIAGEDKPAMVAETLTRVYL